MRFCSELNRRIDFQPTNQNTERMMGERLFQNNMRETPASVAVIGASGYSGEELMDILLRHRGVNLVCLTSRQHAGKDLADIYPKFQHRTGVAMTKLSKPSVPDIVATGAEYAFLALPHGLAHEFAIPLLQSGLRVIDLSADFRLKSSEIYQEFYGESHPAPALLQEAVYGLPEWHRDEIRSARLVAAAGCYPTSILMPLLPLLKEGLLKTEDIFVSSMSGTTGAGRKADVSLLFAECDSSARPYGVPKHRHLSEIEQELSLVAGKEVMISFIPHLIPLRRGICTSIQTRLASGVSAADVGACWKQHYQYEPFVRLLPEGALPDIKHVCGTNFIDLAWREDKRTGRAFFFSAEDNLVKGAAGQAVQSFNLMAGWPETTALIL